MKKLISLLLIFILSGSILFGAEYHVSVKGNDSNIGSETSPLQTINKAAQIALAGDIITVHSGTYREWVNPPRGGTSNENRITYRAAKNEFVEIKGSEIANTWTREENGIWKIILPNSFFGDYNPYVDVIHGDWFNGRNRIHHTGEVFLNNKSLYEKESLDKVVQSTTNSPKQNAAPQTYTWYCKTDSQNTTIWANFNQYDPNKELVEISVRQTCFYPTKPNINYLTIQGFHFSEAASQWAAPTAEQIGMIATHWNKGWIIENNIISNAKCSGVTLGKERGTGHNVWLNDKSIDGSLHYIEVIFRTLRNGWNKENIGSHIVRNNEIFSCEQTGVCGSMGAAFSIIENNYIHDIWEKRQFDGAEIAGIKFHGAIDTQIRNNHIRRTGRGIWLDWMAQGSRVSQNILHQNDLEDLFFEVNHGPYLVDNNILGSPVNVWDMSQGGAYVHNLFAGLFRIQQERTRYTPYHLPHQTDVAGLSIILGGDNRFYNNLFAPVTPKENQTYGLTQYNKTGYPNFVNGNAYYNHAIPFNNEKDFIAQQNFDPKFKIENNGKNIKISLEIKELNNPKTEIIDSEKLGKAKFPKEKYEHPNGTPITFDKDFKNIKRNKNPTPGPFEQLKEGNNQIQIQF
ncbi:MAG: DUF1565 domain-containing protein [Planctomycetaceae bacterium]|jgi:hypothetical protein|nr:DUF1565 domain-containing protein [Planctomycetaceae bacterium]